MSFQFELDPREEASAALIADVAQNLRAAVNEFRASHGGSQSDIAAKLDTDRAVLSKCLSGFRNITLKTLSDIAWAIGAKVEVKVTMPSIVPKNEVYDLSAFMRLNETFIINDTRVVANTSQIYVNEPVVLQYAG
ncbi:helix-turn-helix domain-containing protein [Rhizobium phaseoli]|uniref:helix-turn-helix domain-containing protein n=1 Tax=Rhizobium phaseoli TaxID=396 RepID=UPI0007EB951C|nr:helix-turn-helix transcriptional regulator [Rhizobium phaseoli]ANL45821.1 helix-turn-helix domain-containing protein [Rhizobium phaseoli]